MNSTDRKLTLHQARLAYRRAVQLTLSAFFDKSPQEASALVQAWWERMGKGDVYTTGLFMHDEPVNTAAALAGALKAPAIRDLGQRYFEIIEASMPKQRAPRKKQTKSVSRAAHAA